MAGGRATDRAARQVHYSVRVADFGTTRSIDLDLNMTGSTGTVGWMAPEVFLGKKYSAAADVYR